MAGNKQEWKKMVDYNKQDVILLEKIYLRLRPWIKSHPNMGIYLDRAVCPKCGSGDIEFRGFTMTTTKKYHRFQCKNCGGWGRKIHSEHESKVYASL